MNFGVCIIKQSLLYAYQFKKNTSQQSNSQSINILQKTLKATFRILKTTFRILI